MTATGDERSTKMNEYECESDEDCEVYFLKPVNEYNIVDKIKEANKELFAASVNDGEVNAVVVDSNEVDNATALTVRKVTFAFNLEDYEPETEYALEKGGEGTQQSVEKTTVVSELPAKLGAGLKFPAIDEETLTEQETSGNKEALEDEKQGEAANVSKHSSIEECTQQPSMSVKAEESVERKVTVVEQSAPTGLDEHNTVDEICEEISMLGIDSCGRPLSDNVRRIMKQATFDYDDQYQEDDHEEENSKSLTNLLTSDYEESDDDDNLSIIVATYIPDDYERALLNTPNEEEQTALNARSSHNNSGQLRKTSLDKRFPLRRKLHASTNSIGQKTSTAHLSSASQHIRQRVHKLPPKVTELKLNYKTCCEFRHAVLEKLPKYTGYLSEYGLNREQRQQRDNQAAKKQRYVLEQTLRVSEQDMRKMKDNERAFTTWLKNKMRFPINKTRNMFDVKLS